MKSNQGKGSIIKKVKLAMLLMMMAPLFASCGLHHNIKGNVIDAHTGEPVEGAVVAINWIRYKLAPPGLPTPKARYGTTEDVTDAQGSFTIPNYPIGTHFMGVYKTGYICWSSEIIFNPQGKDEDEMFVHRWEKVKNGMVVKLEPKTGDFPDVKHASFALDVAGRVKAPSPLFFGAVMKERQLYIDYIDERDRKGKK